MPLRAFLGMPYGIYGILRGISDRWSGFAWSPPFHFCFPLQDVWPKKRMCLPPDCLKWSPSPPSNKNLKQNICSFYLAPGTWSNIQALFADRMVYVSWACISGAIASPALVCEKACPHWPKSVTQDNSVASTPSCSLSLPSTHWLSLRPFRLESERQNDGVLATLLSYELSATDTAPPSSKGC